MAAVTTFQGPQYQAVEAYSGVSGVPDGRKVPVLKSGVEVQMWTAKTGGVQVTGLQDLSGAPLPGAVASDENGYIAFIDPDDRYVLWGKFPGVTERVPFIAVEAQVNVGQAITDASNALQIAALANTKSDSAATTSTAADARSQQALTLAQQALGASGVLTVGEDDFTVIAHRGGGGLVWPEESIEAMDAAAAGRFAVECDVQGLVDGTLVCCHDATVDRTMTGIAPGNVADKTLKEWRGARIRPAFDGGTYGTPSTFGDVLDRYGGKVLIAAEIKPAATDDDFNRFVQEILQRNMQRVVLAQSFDYGRAQSMAASGLRVIYLTSGAPTQSPQQIADDSIEIVGCGKAAATEALVESMHGAGVRVMPWTVATEAEHAAVVAAGADGVFSNDPWGTSNRVPVRVSDPFGDGCRPYGMEYQDVGRSAGSDAPSNFIGLPRLIGAGLGFWVAEQPTGSSVGVIRQKWAGLIASPCEITMDVLIEPGGYTGTAIGGLLLTNEINTFLDAANPGQSGWTWLVRNNGEIAAWEYVNGAAAASVWASGQPSPAWPAYGTRRVTLSFKAGSSGVVLSASGPSGIQSSGLIAKPHNWSGLHFGLRYNAPGSVENVRVVGNS